MSHDLSLDSMSNRPQTTSNGRFVVPSFVLSAGTEARTTTTHGRSVETPTPYLGDILKDHHCEQIEIQWSVGGCHIGLYRRGLCELQVRVMV